MNMDGANILITGGTGSFGKRFVKTILQDHKPERVIVLSRDELKQFQMRRISSQRIPKPPHAIG